MENLVDVVRGEDRPDRPATQVIPLEEKFAGMTLSIPKLQNRSSHHRD